MDSPYITEPIEEIVFGGILEAVTGSGPAIIDPSYVRNQAELLLESIRTNLTAQLSLLFDRAGVAVEFNEAIEAAIRVIEGGES